MRKTSTTDIHLSEIHRSTTVSEDSLSEQPSRVSDSDSSSLQFFGAILAEAAQSESTAKLAGTSGISD